MRLVPKSLKWRTLLLTAWALAAVLGTVWYVYGRDIIRTVNRHRENIRLRDHDDLVIRGLARGEIGPDTPVDEFIAANKPKQVLRHGRFVEVVHQGVRLIAMDGKLVYAQYGWCSQAHVFFDRFTPATERECSASLSAHYAQERQAIWNRHAAVAGFGYSPFNVGIKPPPDTGFHVRSPGPRPRDLSRPARVARGAAALTR